MKKLKTIFTSVGSLIWSIVSLIIIILLVVLTVLENTILEPIIGTALGGPMPVLDDSVEKVFTSEYDSKEDSKKAGDALNVQIAEEGFVLLLNEDNALPIATPESDSSVKDKPRVSVFGKNSVNLVLGGTGSGGISGDAAKTIYDGLEKGGFEVNKTLKSFYEDNGASGKGRSNNPKLGTGASSAPTLDIGETPVRNYNANVRNSFKEYSDAAIVVISRVGGESFDLPRFQNVDNGGIAGNHYLQLDNNEYEMLDMVTSKFDKVIVVLNTLASFQCDFIEEYNNSANKRIDAVLWIGGPGSTGAEAIGDLLSGKVNPSGRTTDIYSKDFTKDPTWLNFGDNTQVNDGEDGSGYLENGAQVAGQYMVTYEEGIYVGYRYYETRAYEELQKDASSTWYEDNVMFPFGYGLSYSKFKQEILSVEGSLEGTDGKLTIKVKSTHISGPEGKDVIQLYVNKPYNYGGIEKSYVDLVDYAKTPVLGGSVKEYTATFVVDAYDLASYDYNDANGNDIWGYELEKGTYTFFASENSHVAGFKDFVKADSKQVELEENVYFEYGTTKATEDYKVENRYTTDDFYDVQYRLSDVLVEFEDGSTVTRKGMSRTDFEGTFPTPLTKEERALKTIDSVSEKEFLENAEHNNTEINKVTEMPTMGADGTITLRDMFGKAYNDPDWEKLLDRLTFDEMKELVNNGAFKTSAIMSIEKNLTNDSDGPIGFVNFISNWKGNTTFACESVIGSTWNKDLAYRMGKIVGENGVWGDVNGNGLPYSGWYAPAVNLHRSPFAGRNFEYYSEDPLLSGKMAVNVINGAMTKGVYTDLKHFALNDQETNRSGISTFCTEQALRELYLKPFEIAVKGDDNPAEVESAKDDYTVFKGTMGVMSSFNRIGTRWTGGDYRLLTEILRNEWGFEGLVICDYKTDNSFMHSKQMLYAGNDLILTSVTTYMWTNPDSKSVEDVTILRNAAHNILYTVANSNSVNVKIIGYNMEWWKSLTIALDVIIPVGLAVWGFFAIRRALKKSEPKTEQTEQAEIN